MLITSFPSASDIEHAHERIRPFIHRTPVFESETLNERAQAELWMKAENFQKTGSFKARGALNAVLSLAETDQKKGIVTHSSGNHAQGIAYACKIARIPAYIVMPENSSLVKIQAVKSLGAEITFCKNTPEDRQRTAETIRAQTGATFIHPYNDFRIIEGQATAAKELIEDAPVKLDYLVCPVGGGGLLSGTALAAHYFSSNTLVIASEPEGAADAIRSFQEGAITEAAYIDTLADGLLTTLGDKTFAIIQEHVTDIVTVDDQDIVETMKLVWERVKIVVEPSGVVGLAAVLKYNGNFAGKKVGIILSGGNIDLGNLPF